MKIKTWIGGIAVLLVSGLAYVHLTTPVIYEANTTIAVRPATVSEPCGPTPSRFNEVKQQLVSSTGLQRIIDAYNLYQSMKGKWTQDEIIWGAGQPADGISDPVPRNAPGRGSTGQQSDSYAIH